MMWVLFLTAAASIFGLSAAENHQPVLQESSAQTTSNAAAIVAPLRQDLLEVEVEEELVLRVLSANLTEYDKQFEKFRASTVFTSSEGSGSPSSRKPVLFTHGSVKDAKADPALAGFHIRPVKHKRLRRDSGPSNVWDDSSHELGVVTDDFMEVKPETIHSARFARRAGELYYRQGTKKNDDYGKNEVYPSGPKEKKTNNPYLSACKVSGSHKVAHCKKGQVCTPVLPHKKTCKTGIGYAGCPLEPRCLTLKESKKCEYDETCRLEKSACIIAEECGKEDANYCAYWPRCFDLGTFGDEEDDSDRVDSYFKFCQVKGSKKKALCLKEEKCVRSVQLTDPCLIGKTCYCTQYEPGCLVPGTESCEDLQCKRKCEYFPSSGCNQFVLGPCCQNQRKPYLLTCPVQPYCLIDYLKIKAKKQDDAPPLPSDICDLTWDKGYPCKPEKKYGGILEAVIRWSFTYKFGCQPSVFLGCGGNRNNFKTEAECQNSCLVGRVDEKESTPAAGGSSKTQKENYYQQEKKPAAAYYPEKRSDDVFLDLLEVHSQVDDPWDKR